MNKVLHVAWREFTATVLTKGFLLGVILLPVIMLIAVPAALFLVSMKPPPVEGRVALIDRTGGPDAPGAGGAGLVAPEFEARFTPAAIEEAVRSRAREAGQAAQKQVQRMMPQQPGMPDIAATAEAAIDVPRLSSEVMAPDADVEAAKRTLLETPADKSSQKLALIVTDPDAVVLTEGTERFGAFQLYTRAKLDARVQALIRAQAREAVIQARLKASGQDPARVRALMRMDIPDAVAVTSEGEKKTSELQQMMLPLAFMMLLWISVFTGGQFLLTSTIEEKSNRIMEVLLSAVSPMQLMTGKIIGQMAAGLLILTVYSGLGIIGLIVAARMDLIEWQNLLFLGIFFFIAFFLIASMMAAVGAAVTDIHEAQTLMTPIMIVVMLPMLLMMPIIWNPDSTLATVMSFIPPINPFVMVLRLSSSSPPPLWQTLLSIGVGVVAVLIMLKAAAKVFRIGVLMYGKPPNFATLIRWVRMA
jgi:ABC-2 type transport system permease protein